MVGGFNHNFSYKGQTYHIQTEDSGVQRARITTLLYRAGSILARETTDYSSICAEADLNSRVEQLMKDQHRAVLKSLKSGVFDAKIAQLDVSAVDAADIKEVAEDEVKKSAGTEDTPGVSKPSAPVSVSEGRSRHLEDKVKAYLDAGR
jgi:hypothetical protein